MANLSDIETALAGLLAPGEHVEHAVVCQPRRGQKGQLARAAGSAGLSAAASTAAGMLGASTGVLVLKVPAAVWVVITDIRLLMFPRQGYHNTTRSIGALTFAAPREAVTSTWRSGLMHTVVIEDAVDSRSLLSLRFGVRRAAARLVAEACRGPSGTAAG